ncbi:polysaccharide biosynthesis tyrosine autokinase [Alteromonas sediminis]|uniref:non-specific protein-tyrosine kinase n=1 Tax=Alteromonas sediminis TaxID=2259342 RepID=A0A3N5YAF1_9ALTE|nr:polysaccharide biosynthesis tyrosine autokinase [Alteromonas sediminis]RPJ68519.1 polysaccharide biosynthesis tyrosine autokinase [Alteromonas sediminis]
MNSVSNLNQQGLDNNGHPAHHEDDLIDLGQYWRTIKRGKWIILLITLSCLILGGLLASNMTPLYQATSKILADPQQPNANRDEQYIASALVFLFYETQYEIIQSRNIAETVVDKLGLVEKYKQEQAALKAEPKSGLSAMLDNWKMELSALAGKEEAAAPAKPLSDAEIKTMLAMQIQGGLEVSGGKQSQVINVSYSSDDPQKAADIINAVADAYIAFGLESRLGEVRNTEQWLGEQYQKLGEKLQESEAALSAYRSSQGLVDTSQQERLANAQLQNLNSELIRAQTKLSEETEQYQAVQSVTPGTPGYYSLAPVLANKTASDMVKEQAARAREVEQLEQRYGEKHPRMIAARSALKSTRDNLNSEIEKIIANVEKNYRSAQTQVQNVQRLIAESRAEIQGLQGNNLELVRLEREVENNRRVYESFQSQLMQANVNSEFDASNVHIIDRATVPKAPYKPNKKLILVLAGMFGLFAGTVLVFLKELLDNTFKTPDNIEDKIKIPSLGITPVVKKSKSESTPEKQYLDDPRSTFSESINTIRTGLLFSNIDNPPKTVLVTSSTGSEGKSTLALNLAAAYSNIGKTLLLEVDLRKPSIARYLGLTPQEGLSELVTGSVQNTESLLQTKVKDNLTVITSGAMPRNPAELLSSKKFEKVMEALKRNFDYIVLDGPPTLPVSDSCILGNKMDAVVMAVKAEDTKVNVAKEAIKRLRNHNANVIGAVLTVAEPNKMSYYGNHYYAEEYYGDVDPKELKVANV